MEKANAPPSAHVNGEVLQERAVINEELVIKAVKDNRMQQFDHVGNAPDYDEPVELHDIYSLVLSFKVRRYLNRTGRQGTRVVSVTGWRVLSCFVFVSFRKNNPVYKLD